MPTNTDNSQQGKLGIPIFYQFDSLSYSTIFPHHREANRMVRKRFDDEFIAYLLELKWWDWDIEKIEANFKALSSNDLSLIKDIKL